MHLPEFEHLRTVRQLCEEYPHLFTEGSLRWWIFQRERNGFSSCIVRIGRRLYIDTRALQAWLEGHRGSTIVGGPGGHEVAAKASRQLPRAGDANRSGRP